MKRSSDCLDYWGDFSCYAPQESKVLTPVQVKRFKKEEIEDKADNRINFCLAPGDRLLECPYQKSHLILEQRWIRHLCKCRSNYLKECAAKKAPITVGICKWNNGHHIHLSQLPVHERFCPERRKDAPTDMDYFTGPKPKTMPKECVKENIDVDDDVPSTSDEEDDDNFDGEESSKRFLQIEADDIEQQGIRCSRSRNRAHKVKRKEVTTAKTEDWDIEPATVNANQAAYNPREAILRNNIPFIPIPPGLTKTEKNKFRMLQVARVRNGPAFDEDGPKSVVKGYGYRRKSN